MSHAPFRYYGGWVCKNIFYLGHAGVIRVGGLRIAGLSGIFYGKDFKRGYYEREPYSSDMLRSAYHYREFEIEKLKMVHAHTAKYHMTHFINPSCRLKMILTSS